MGAKVCRHWTQQERDYIDDKWGLISSRKIAKQLNRTVGAVRRYAEKNQLGGSCFNAYYYTTGDVADELNIDITSVSRLVREKKLKATSRCLGNGHKVYLIEPEVYKEFIKSYKPRNYNVWTTLQEKRLLELVYEGKSDLEIANILGKTKASVNNKKLRLLRKKREEEK